MNTQDMGYAKINLDCARSELINLVAMLGDRLEGYQTLDNMPESTIQNFIFERYIFTVLKHTEESVSNAFYRIPDIEESDN